MHNDGAISTVNSILHNGDEGNYRLDDKVVVMHFNYGDYQGIEFFSSGGRL